MIDTLISAVGERDLLLVMDNCEHVIDAAAAVASGCWRPAEGSSCW